MNFQNFADFKSDLDFSSFKCTLGEPQNRVLKKSGQLLTLKFLEFDKSNLIKLKLASINVEQAYIGYKLNSAFGTSDQKRKFESS